MLLDGTAIVGSEGRSLAPLRNPNRNGNFFSERAPGAPHRLLGPRDLHNGRAAVRLYGRFRWIQGLEDVLRARVAGFGIAAVVGQCGRP